MTAPPVIASQPQAQVVGAGTSATFSVSSVNATTYRWQSSPDAGATWTDVAGATASSLTLPTVSLVDGATQFRVLLTNANGTTASSVVSLNVRPNLRLLAGALGGQGYRDGTPAESRLKGPRGVAGDAAGNVYVTDGNHVIRRIAPNGTMTTVAGTPGQPGRVDGPAAAAKFDSPRSIALDASGALWVVDQGTCFLRRIAQGQVTSFADLGSENCFPMGSQRPDQYNPTEVAIGPGGDIFVADDSRHVIRRVDASGAVSVYAGTEGVQGSADGPRTSAQFYSPRGLAVDAAGTLYVADWRNHTVRRIAADGSVTTLAGTAGSAGHVDSVGAAARFTYPRGVAIAGGYLVVSESAHVIRRIDLATGAVTTLAGQAGVSGFADGIGTAARFAEPYGVAIDAAGTAYVADANNHMVRRVSAAGVVTRLAGQMDPVGSADGTGAAARFSTANQITVDAAGNLYAGERFAGRNSAGERYGSTIRKISPAGVVTTLAGAPGLGGSYDGIGSEARFDGTRYIAVTRDGTVYVAGDRTDHDCLIRRVSPAGEVLTIAGIRGSCYRRDGNPVEARFLPFTGIAVDSAGNVAVAEIVCGIRLVVGAMTSTVAGGGDKACAVVDGPAAVATIAEPHALVFEPSGALLFADRGPVVRRLKTDGSIETVAGSAAAGNADGTGAEARFQDITAMAVDAAGRIHVVDSGNHAVRLIEAGGRVRTLIPLNVGPRVVLGEGGSLNAPIGIALLPGGAIAVTSEFGVLMD